MAQRSNESRYVNIKPTEKYMSFVATKASGDYTRLLANLGVPHDSITSFRADYPKVWDVCYNGLMFWLKEGDIESGEPATFGTLFEALRESQMTNCVSLLVEKLDQRSTHHPRPTVAGEDPSTQTTKQEPIKQLSSEQDVPQPQLDIVRSTAPTDRRSSPSPVQPLPTPQHRHKTPPAQPHSATVPAVFRSSKDKQRSENTMPDLLFGTYSASPVTIGREVYIAGGITIKLKDTTANLKYKLVQVYGIDNGKCRTLPPAPQYNCQAVAIQGNLVLIGGKDSSTTEITNLVSTWMTREEKWTQTALPPMNVKRFRPGVLLLDSLLFVFGGLSEDKKSPLDTFEVLNLNTKQWRKTLGRLPAPMFYTQAGLFRDHVMLVCGSSTVGTATIRTACYTVPVQALEDSATNPSFPPIQWTQVQNTPDLNSALLTTSQDAVLIGGNSKDRQVTRDIHRFGSGSWELIGKLSQPRVRPVVVADSERSFIVFGGFTDPNDAFESIVQTVESFSYDM